MKFTWKMAIAITALALAACKPQSNMISLGGAPTDDSAVVARVKEGTMLMRGLDGKHLELNQKANPFKRRCFCHIAGPSQTACDEHSVRAHHTNGEHALLRSRRRP